MLLRLLLEARCAPCWPREMERAQAAKATAAKAAKVSLEKRKATQKAKVSISFNVFDESSMQLWKVPKEVSAHRPEAPKGCKLERNALRKWSQQQIHTWPYLLLRKCWLRLFDLSRPRSAEPLVGLALDLSSATKASTHL